MKVKFNKKDIEVSIGIIFVMLVTPVLVFFILFSTAKAETHDYFYEYHCYLHSKYDRTHKYKKFCSDYDIDADEEKRIEEEEEEEEARKRHVRGAYYKYHYN